jgi:flavin reductase (DIM6/NTAB) family NADH-FMN oxidoreductase RutF
MVLHKKDIEHFEQQYRTTFINSLAGFRQAVLVGTRSAKNIPNLAIFNSLIHLGANPALLGLISRPGSVQRHTFQNIIDTREYTLNYVQATYYAKAHQTSARYGHNISEFEKAGFNEFYHSDCTAPFAEEAAVKIAMKFEESIPIPLNGTFLIIGSILHIDIDDATVGYDGFVNLASSEILISQGLDAYFVAKEIGRLPYAKP